MSDRVFYILDSRTCVGNCALWWAKDRGGYCCNLADAGLYTLEEALSERPTDVPVHKDVAQNCVTQHVRWDTLSESVGFVPHRREAYLKDLRSQFEETTSDDETPDERPYRGWAVVFTYSNKFDGDPVFLQCGGRAKRETGLVCSTAVEDYILEPPDSAGIWIWEGHVLEFHIHDDADWEGAWRRPTPLELSRISDGKLLENPEWEP